jgi:hypothetical protein
MSDAFQARVAALDAAVLTPLVRSALSNRDVEIKQWRVDTLSLNGGGQFAGVLGLLRVRGEAYDGAGGRDLPWSLMLKAFGGGGTGSEHQHEWNYWKREPLLYQSGLLAPLPPGGLIAPRCYGVTAYGDDEYWVWMEEIQEHETRWSLAQFGVAARHLGQFNGAYLAGYPLPQAQPWFTWGRVREWCEFFQPIAERALQHANTALGKQLFRGDTLAETLHFWERRAALLDPFERLPVCFCHHDAYRRNLMARPTHAQTVAVDWAISGFGRVGEEAGAMTAVSLTFMEAAAGAAGDLDQTVFAGYLDGLRDSGWRGDPRQARLGYLTNALLPLGLGLMIFYLEILQSDEGRASELQAIGAPADEILEQWAEIQPFLLDLGAEALQLAAEFA